MFFKIIFFNSSAIPINLNKLIKNIILKKVHMINVVI